MLATLHFRCIAVLHLDQFLDIVRQTQITSVSMGNQVIRHYNTDVVLRICSIMLVDTIAYAHSSPQIN